MAKVRVYELAKELGVESKTVLSMLKDMGEFVRSASSTVEAPVVRRLKEKLASEPPPAKKTAEGQAAAPHRPRRGAGRGTRRRRRPPRRGGVRTAAGGRGSGPGRPPRHRPPRHRASRRRPGQPAPGPPPARRSPTRSVRRARGPVRPRAPGQQPAARAGAGPR